MNKDLISSKVARDNVLNNRYAVREMQNVVGLKGILFNGEYRLTKRQVASFFEVSERSLSACIIQNEQVIKKTGYEVISGKSLKEFKLAFAQTFGEEANFPTKTTILGTFNFRAFLNLAMLLEKSDRAREVRSLVLDIVLDTINNRTGGNTKYINQETKILFLIFFKMKTIIMNW